MTDRLIEANGQLFESYEDAAPVLLDVPQPTAVFRPFSFMLIGNLIDRSGAQYFQAMDGTRVGEVVRFKQYKIEEGVGVSTAGGLTTVIAHAEPWDSRLLDRGLAWVTMSTSERNKPIFSVNVKPGHNLDVPEVSERLEAAETKATDLINDILDGNPQPRHALQPEQV